MSPEASHAGAEGPSLGVGTPDSAQPKVPVEAQNCLVSKIGSQLYASKHISWRGPGELMQLPWATAVKGLVLVLDLWAGFSGALVALLALGVRVVALAAESNADARAVASRNFPGLVHVEWVESVQARDIRAMLQRRSVTAILIGGGSPCQGNSKLNRKRRNLDDPRSQQPLELRRIFDETSALEEVQKSSITVLLWLENVASATEETKQAYDEWLGASRVRIDAKYFGWVARNRCFWGRSQTKTLVDADLGTCRDATVIGQGSIEPELRYSAAKPIPRILDIEDGFTLGIKPKAVMQTGEGALFPFTREFWHPRDQGIERRVSAGALARWESDLRRFPPAVYEAENLAWRDNEWRTLSPKEGATLHGLPARILDAVPTEGRTYAETRAVQNSLLGNGFHIPSLMLFFMTLFSLVEQAPASAIPSAALAYAPDEAALRRSVAGTVFQPGILRDVPGVLSSAALMREIQRQLHGTFISEEAWTRAADKLTDHDVADLQVYWVDTQWRHLCPSPQGPQWSAQVSKACLPASLGMQRYPGNSRRGLDHLVMPGLGKTGHLNAVSEMSSPFRPGQAVDDDVAFCSRALAILGPHLPHWRRRQERRFRRLARALAPVSMEIEANLTPRIKAVAAGKRPAVIAACVALLRWPDREQAHAYIHGFQVLGDIPSAHVFRQLGTMDDGDALMEDFWGQDAESAVHELLASRPPGQAEEIFRATTAEQEKGWLGPFLEAQDLNRRYGPGKWRFIPRFLLKQRLRERVIDDAKRGGQNQCTRNAETIYTISVDWLGECVSSMVGEVASHCCGLQPDSATEIVLGSLPE